MLHCTVKFCGGCNPRHDRGECYGTVRSALSDAASFSLPEEGAHYDVLLIIRGCTGCPYLYEEIEADRRVVIASRDDMQINGGNIGRRRFSFPLPRPGLH